MSNGRVLFCKFSPNHSSPAVRPIVSRSAIATARPIIAIRPFAAVALLLAGSGCSELQARHHAREGNDRFVAGDYAGAVAQYEVAEQKYPPGLHVIELNKGL